MKKFMYCLILICFSFNIISPDLYAQTAASSSGAIGLTELYQPVLVLGLNINQNDPFRFDFIIDQGTSDVEISSFMQKEEAKRLVNYFLASLTIPEDKMWVNLSPYEKNRIVPELFGQTEMGRDLLAQDYVLKQLVSSLMYPDGELGEKFWDNVYEQTRDKFGITEIPQTTFNKVWIVPDTAKIYEHEKGAFITEAKLKVMLDEDYLALEMNQNSNRHGLGDIKQDQLKQIAGISTEVFRTVILPAVEKEVNEGKTFAKLRQVYHAMLLANWYKQKLKEAIAQRVKSKGQIVENELWHPFQNYIDHEKIKGISTDDPQAVEKIYNQYVDAFKRGAYDLIKEEYDPVNQQIIPRKYFSGGVNFDGARIKTADSAMIDVKALGSKILKIVTWSPFSQSQVKPKTMAIRTSIIAGALIFLVVSYKSYIGPLELLKEWRGETVAGNVVIQVEKSIQEGGKIHQNLKEAFKILDTLPKGMLEETDSLYFVDELPNPFTKQGRDVMGYETGKKVYVDAHYTIQDLKRIIVHEIFHQLIIKKMADDENKSLDKIYNKEKFSYISERAGRNSTEAKSEFGVQWVLNYGSHGELSLLFDENISEDKAFREYTTAIANLWVDQNDDGSFYIPFFFNSDNGTTVQNILIPKTMNPAKLSFENLRELVASTPKGAALKRDYENAKAARVQLSGIFQTIAKPFSLSSVNPQSIREAYSASKKFSSDKDLLTLAMIYEIMDSAAKPMIILNEQAESLMGIKGFSKEMLMAGIEQYFIDKDVPFQNRYLEFVKELEAESEGKVKFVRDYKKIKGVIDGLLHGENMAQLASLDNIERVGGSLDQAMLRTLSNNWQSRNPFRSNNPSRITGIEIDEFETAFGKFKLIDLLRYIDLSLEDTLDEVTGEIEKTVYELSRQLKMTPVINENGVLDAREPIINRLREYIQEHYFPNNLRMFLPLGVRKNLSMDDLGNFVKSGRFNLNHLEVLLSMFNDVDHWQDGQGIFAKYLKSNADQWTKDDLKFLNFLVKSTPKQILKFHEQVDALAQGHYEDGIQVERYIEKTLFNNGIKVNLKKIASKIFYWAMNEASLIYQNDKNFNEAYQELGSYGLAFHLQHIFSQLLFTLYPPNVPVYRSVEKKYAGKPGEMGYNVSYWGVGKSGENVANAYASSKDKPDTVVLMSNFGILRRDGAGILEDIGSALNAKNIRVVHQDENALIGFRLVENVKPVGESTDDSAMIEPNKGGIDLNPAAVRLNVSQKGSGFNMPLFNANDMESDMFNMTEIAPVIIDITPVKDLPLLLSMTKDNH